MSDPVYDKSQPNSSVEPNFTPANPAKALSTVASTVHDPALLANVNAAPSPQLDSEPALPVLPEQTLTGYSKGTATQFVAVSLDGFQVDKNTAYDFIMMRNSAAKAGIPLIINSAFRPMAMQQKLWDERMKPDGNPTPLGIKLGPAAKPGWSNHQSGKALDLAVGLTIADRLAGRTNAIFDWLKLNAEKFGFDNTDIPPKYPEPWHWRHQSNAVVGTPETKDYFAALLDLPGTAAAYAQGNGSLGKKVYDKLWGISRSVSMSMTGRDTFYAEKAASAADAGSACHNMSSVVCQADTRFNAPRSTMDETTLDPLVYNFDTGLWGDNKAV